MHSYKRYIVILSASSFLSAVLISGLTLFLLVDGGPISITADKVSGTEIGAAAGVVHCLLNFLLHSFYSPKTYEEKSQIQIANVIKGCCLLLVACFTFHIIAVCFGAPLLTLTSETFHFAILLTVLVCLPFCVFFGPSTDTWLDVFITNSSQVGLETVVYFTSICAVLGSWLGALPIPLDWDRPWQEWPVTCVIGAMGGYSVGLFLSAVQLPRKYRSLHKSKFF